MPDRVVATLEQPEGGWNYYLAIRAEPVIVAVHIDDFAPDEGSADFDERYLMLWAVVETGLHQ